MAFFLFDFVDVDRTALGLDDLNRTVVLSHQPMECGEGINFCGHVHGDWNKIDRAGRTHYNVGVDVRDFRPVTVEEILATFPFQKPVVNQHHPFEEKKA